MIPIGVASISLTCRIPSAVTDLICPGSGLLLMTASRAGIRLSRISVVLPEPETPVTAIIRPLGKSASSGLTVWICPVERWILPMENISCAGTCLPRSIILSPDRNGPIRDAGSFSISARVPLAITVPPWAPASGPISISQSASFRILMSWSTRTTVLPSFSRSRMTPLSPSKLEG